MGRDITLYPKKASRDDLKKYIEGLGFIKCEHLWDWPKGTLNYSWFDHEDFKSIDGVSADIYPVIGNEINITGNKWALHVRNLYSASWYDVKMLNDVLKGAKKLFDGIIQGDYGINGYAPLWEDKSTPISRGISAIYRHVKQEISAVIYALPEPSIKQSKLTSGKTDAIIKFTESLDPSRVIYNGPVPFAVSMFEYFFSQVFQVLIKHDPDAFKKRKELTVENVIARNYTFQNPHQLNKAYRDWLGIDVRSILYKKRKIGNSRYNPF